MTRSRVKITTGWEKQASLESCRPGAGKDAAGPGAEQPGVRGLARNCTGWAPARRRAEAARRSEGETDHAEVGRMKGCLGCCTQLTRAGREAGRQRGRELPGGGVRVPCSRYACVVCMSACSLCPPAPGRPLWLAVVAFAESSFFPRAAGHALLIPMVAARPERAWWLAGLCTAASVAGWIVGLCDRVQRCMRWWPLPLIHFYHYEDGSGGRGGREHPGERGLARAG